MNLSKILIFILSIIPVQFAHADNPVEVDCKNGNISLIMNWPVSVGESGNNVRHLLFGSSFGSDIHILMRIQKNPTTTGITNNSQQAKAVIQSMLNKTRDWEIVHMQVFPEGRDHITGEWETIKYKYSEFKLNVVNSAKKCEWNLNEKIDLNIVNTVQPGAAYEK